MCRPTPLGVASIHIEQNGLWSVEDQWGRVTDVVLQYEVHREAVGPPLPSGEVINHNNDQYSVPNISLSQKSHVSHTVSIGESGRNSAHNNYGSCMRVSENEMTSEFDG